MGETIKAWLEHLATSNSSTVEDSAKMQKLLHLMGFPKAVVTYGVVYLEGYGQASSINQIAKMLLDLVEKAQREKK